MILHIRELNRDDDHVILQRHIGNLYIINNECQFCVAETRNPAKVFWLMDPKIVKILMNGFVLEGYQRDDKIGKGIGVRRYRAVRWTVIFK